MIKTFFVLLLGVSCQDSLEIQLLQTQVDLLKQRLTFLETAIPEELSPSKLETAASQIYFKESEAISNFASQLSKFKREKSANTVGAMGVGIGERLTLTFTDEENQKLRILYYDLMPVRPYQDNQQRCSHVIIALNSDNSIVISTMSGFQILRHKVQLEADDEMMRVVAPSGIDEEFFSVLTRKGQLIVLTYNFFDSRLSYFKYLQDIRKKTLLGTEDKTQLAEYSTQDKTEADQFNRVQILVNKEDLFSVQQLIGRPHVSIEHALIMQSKKQKYFVFADSDGWISAVGKTLTLRAQFKAALPSSIIWLGSMQTTLVIGMKEAVAFSNLQDNIVTGLCEYTQMPGQHQILSVAFENQKSGQFHYQVYAQTSNHQILVFHPKINTKGEFQQCELLSKVQIPEEFHLRAYLAINVIKGAVVLQNTLGQMAVLETSADSVQQSPSFKIFSPTYMPQVSSKGEIKESKIVGQANKQKGHYLLTRVSEGTIALLEFIGQTKIAKYEESAQNADWGFGKSAVLFVILFGGFIFFVTHKNSQGLKKFGMPNKTGRR